MTLIDDIKTRKGISNATLDSLIQALITNTHNYLTAVYGVPLDNLTDIDFITQDIVIERLNRMDNEGFTSASQDGYSFSVDYASVFEKYSDMINAYLESKGLETYDNTKLAFIGY